MFRSTRSFCSRTDSDAVEALSLVVATGANARWLTVPNEERLAQIGGGGPPAQSVTLRCRFTATRCLVWWVAATQRWRKRSTRRSTRARYTYLFLGAMSPARRRSWPIAYLASEDPRALEQARHRGHRHGSDQGRAPGGHEHPGAVSDLTLGGLSSRSGTHRTPEFLGGQLELTPHGNIRTKAWRTGDEYLRWRVRRGAM